MGRKEQLEQMLAEEKAKLESSTPAPENTPSAEVTPADVTPAPENPPAPTPAPKPPKAEGVDYFQQWSTQNGLLKQQQERIAALEAELKKKNEEGADVLAKMSELLSKAPVQPEPKPDATVQSAQSVPFTVQTVALTEAEETVLGGSDTELASAIRKIALQIFAESGVPAIESRIASVEARMGEIEKALRDELTGVKTQVETVVKTEESRQMSAFEKELAGLVPNYVAINDSADFQKWASETVDMLTGIPYSEIYMHHLTKTHNAQNVAFIMNEYVKARGLVPEPKQEPAASVPQQTVTPAPGADASGIPAGLEEQIAPGRSSGAGDASETTPKKQLTQDEVYRLGLAAATSPTVANLKAFEDAKKQFEQQFTAQARQGK